MNTHTFITSICAEPKDINLSSVIQTIFETIQNWENPYFWGVFFGKQKRLNVIMLKSVIAPLLDLCQNYRQRKESLLL